MSGERAAVSLQSVHRALKAGRKIEARRLLRQLTEWEPENYRAWLLLAGLTQDIQESVQCIARAEALRPGDAVVQQAREWAEEKLREGQPNTSVPSANSPTPVYENTPPQTLSIPPAPRRVLFPLRALLFGVLLVASLSLLASIGYAWLVWQDSPAEAHLSTADLAPDDSSSAATPPPTQTLVKETARPDPSATPNPVSPKNVVARDVDLRTTWTPTPIPTDTPTPTPTYAPTFVAEGSSAPALPGTVLSALGLSANERWIDVNVSNQTLVAYEGALPVFETLVSTGRSQHPTVTGQFRIWLRLESQDMNGYRLGYDYYLKGVPYVQYFFQDYALHGTYWHNNFGTPMSHGCVNLSTADAAWVFDFADYGTLVNIHP